MLTLTNVEPDQQGFTFRPDWWAARIQHDDWTDWLTRLPEEVSGARRICRADLFAMPVDEPDDLVRLLIGCYVWGAGPQPRLVGRYTQVLRHNDHDRVRESLTAAHRVLVTEGAVEAYRSLRGGPNRLAYLGPSFFTKFLYFADRTRRALILDRFVAAELRSGLGWDFHRTGWTTAEYKRWLDHAHETAIAESVRPDLIEITLFQAGKARLASPPDRDGFA